MLSDTLRKILVCPVDSGELRDNGTTELICQRCRRRYRVREGIPVMLAGEDETVTPPPDGKSRP